MKKSTILLISLLVSIIFFLFIYLFNIKWQLKKNSNLMFYSGFISNLDSTENKIKTWFVIDSLKSLTSNSLKQFIIPVKIDVKEFKYLQDTYRIVDNSDTLIPFYYKKRISTKHYMLSIKGKVTLVLSKDTLYIKLEKKNDEKFICFFPYKINIGEIKKYKKSYPEIKFQFSPFGYYFTKGQSFINFSDSLKKHEFYLRSDCTSPFYYEYQDKIYNCKLNFFMQPRDIACFVNKLN